MNNPKRILLVDNDPRLLRGMQRQLGLTPWDWDVVLADGGAQALEILAESGASFNVIMTAVWMTGIDGAALLQQVKQNYPHLVRIAMSGHTDRDTALRTAGLAHQFVARPSSPDVLQNMLQQVFALRQMLASEQLLQLVGQMSTLPSLPAMFQNLLDEIQSPEANLQHVGDIISQDIGMTAKILQLVNSAFFGLRRRVSNPTQAVSLLGLDTIKALVLSAHVFSQFQGARLGVTTPQQLQQHSLMVGMLAQRITEFETNGNKLLGDYAFTAGLLHDAGRLVLAANLPAEYERATQQVEQHGLSLVEAERAVFNATHAEVGAYLLGIWGLPDSVVEAVAYHHQPGGHRCVGFCPLIAVHAANALFKESYTGPAESVLPEIDEPFLARHNVLTQLPHWRKICAEANQNAGEL